MSKSQFVPVVKTETNGLSVRSSYIKEAYLVKGKKDVYLVEYMDGSKKLVYTYEESEIIPQEGIKKIDFSEFTKCIKIIEIDDVDYAICETKTGVVKVVELPNKEIIFEIFRDSTVSLKKLDEKYIEIFSMNMKESKIYDKEQRMVCKSIPSGAFIEKNGNYFILKSQDNKRILLDESWKQLWESDEIFYVKDNKLVFYKGDSIIVVNVNDIMKPTTFKPFEKQKNHIYKPIYVEKMGEIIVFEKRKILIYDLDFIPTQTIDISELDTKTEVDYDGSLLFIYGENNRIFINLETKDILTYTNIWRHPYDNPSSFVGINNHESIEDTQIYHIHDKNFKKVIDINVAGKKDVKDPIYETEDGVIYTIKDIKNKWILVNTINGKISEAEGYLYFQRGRECICGIKVKEGKKVIDVFDMNFTIQAQNVDCEKYGLIISTQPIKILPISIVGRYVLFEGRLDIGALNDEYPSYIVDSDGNLVFGYDKDKNAIALEKNDLQERSIQKIMRKSTIEIIKAPGDQTFFKITNGGNGDIQQVIWLNSNTGAFYALKSGKLLNCGTSFLEAIEMRDFVGITPND